MKSWSEKNDIEIHSTSNEVKSVVGKRFIRTLRKKIYKYMIWISKNVYIDKLDDVVSKCNNTYYMTIKNEPAQCRFKPYIDFKNENNNEDPKFKVGDNVRISKYENIFAKGYVRNCSEEGFVITKV